MTLSSGTRLGPYQLVASLGAGGMGEVYRAKDTRLDRTPDGNRFLINTLDEDQQAGSITVVQSWTAELQK